MFVEISVSAFLKVFLLSICDLCFRKAYQRISEGISEFEEDHLDLDLVEEGEYLERYLAMLRK